MTLVDTIYLTFAICAFAGYGLLLFSVWLTVEVFGKPRASAKPAEASPEADAPMRAAA